jgi:hypothetical protein
MTNHYEFGDFSFIENNQQYYNHTIFLSIIKKYNLWDDVYKFDELDNIRFNNLRLLFWDKYNNMDQLLEKEDFIEIMDNFQTIREEGWSAFVENNS